MKRSPGVTAAAIVAFLGSGLTILMGVLVVSVGLTGMSRASVPAGQNFPPGFLFAVMITESLVYFAFAGWGIASAVGLLNLKEWARVSVLVFGSLTLAMCGVLAAFVWLIQLPSTPGTPSVDWRMIKAIASLIFLAPTAIASWWLVLFNLRSVRTQFAGVGTFDVSGSPIIAAQPTTLAARRPVSITIIAVLFLFGALSVMAAIPLKSPLIFFGHFIEGGAARFGYLLMLAIHLYLGIELLRLKPLARQVGIYFKVFAFLNTLMFLALPGWDARIALLLSKTPQYYPSPIPNMGQFLRFTMGLGLVLPLVILWFLITRKRAFAPPESSQTA